MPIQYYAVAIGRKPGLYHDWDTCDAQVSGYPGARYRAFTDRSEAEEFVLTVNPGAEHNLTVGDFQRPWLDRRNSDLPPTPAPAATPVTQIVVTNGDAEKDASAKAYAPKAYYAVAVGRRPGVYYDWPTCSAQVTGYPGARYKSFQDRNEAEEFALTLNPGAEEEMLLNDLQRPYLDRRSSNLPPLPTPAQAQPLEEEDQPKEGEQSTWIAETGDERVFASLTYDTLDVKTQIDRVRSPKAGAIVLFSGTTRDNFENKPVTHLSYESYVPLALSSLTSIATTALQRWNLEGVAVTHRLGTVGVGEESILIAVSCGHRRESFEAGEWILEEVKKRAEVWKREEYGVVGEEAKWKENFEGARPGPEK
ncbi:hypothetical protein YB2330_001958 [Saitoella coloradoensis]